MPRRVHLHHGNVLLALAPEVGCGVVHLQWKGRDIFRPGNVASLNKRDPQGLSEFPLVPFANRIEFGVIGGIEVRLLGNVPGQAHALHGVGWQSEWTETDLAAGDPTQVRFELHHGANELWPWDFMATRTFIVSDDNVEFGLSVVNTTPQQMPVSLGFHPYFPNASATLAAVTKARIEVDNGGIPRGTLSAENVTKMADGERAEDLVLDHCFAGWDGHASLRYPTHQVEIIAQGCPYLQVYAPAKADFLCLEPMSAMPDAFNQPPSVETGARWLKPGETAQIHMRLRFSTND